MPTPPLEWSFRKTDEVAFDFEQTESTVFKNQELPASTSPLLKGFEEALEMSSVQRWPSSDIAPTQVKDSWL